MKKIRLFVLVFAFSALSGCATLMYRQDCAKVPPAQQAACEAQNNVAAFTDLLELPFFFLF